MNEQENKAEQYFKKSTTAEEAAKNAWKFGMDDSLSDREKLHQLGELIKNEAATVANYKEQRAARKKAVADRLQQIRKERGLMQKEVADKTGINIVTLSGYEIGKNEPNLEALVRLANVYEVSLDYLMCRTNEKKIII